MKSPAGVVAGVTASVLLVIVAVGWGIWSLLAPAFVIVVSTILIHQFMDKRKG